MTLSVPPDFYLDETVYSGSYEPQFTSQIIVGNFTITPVFSPDTSERAICNLIKSAKTSIYIEQLYVYKDWKNKISPFVEKLINKSSQGVDIKVILNYNPSYEPTNEVLNKTKQYLEKNNIEVKFVYTNWSYFTNVHNKGMIVDNKSVLISSINWNENSVKNNREAGIIIENEEVATYYAEVFFYDWELTPPKTEDFIFSLADYKNPFLILLVYSITFALIAKDWRKREW
jgi:phosphatidylserine/phosphatidylglycerophosphate/cardiolipin synthase-like enzyme